MTYQQTETLVTKNCPACGIFYGIPKSFNDSKYNNGGSWCCPNGHPLVFTKTEVDQLKTELANAKASRDSERSLRVRAQNEADHFRKSRDGMKGQLTLVKKRLANGICPCCNRYFVELHHHMTTQHSDFLAETGIVTLLETPTADAFDAAVENLSKGKSTSTKAQYRSVCRALKGFLFPGEAS